MIYSRQVPYKTPIGGAEESPIQAWFVQGYHKLYADSWLMPWAIFGTGTLTKCFGSSTNGLFTAEVYLDEVLIATVTDADTTTSVAVTGGDIVDFATITCKIISATVPLNTVIWLSD